MGDLIRIIDEYLANMSGLLAIGATVEFLQGTRALLKASFISTTLFLEILYIIEIYIKKLFEKKKK